MGGHKTRANSSASQYVASELSPSYFPRLPVRPPCHGFPSVHPVVASISLLPNEALPKLFPTVSPPATLSSLPSRSLPTEQLFPTASRPSISLLPNGALPKLFPTVLRPPCRRFNLAPSNGALPKLFPTVLRPPCRRFHHAPSQLSPPQAISHSFPSVHPLVASVSLPSRQSQLNENASIGDAFGKNT